MDEVSENPPLNFDTDSVHMKLNEMKIPTALLTHIDQSKPVKCLNKLFYRMLAHGERA